MNVMKHISIYILMVISSLALQAQVVTVNTTTSASNAVWHLDGAGDNTASITDTQALNDLVITSEGKLGVGNIVPSVQVDVKTRSVPAFRMEDGWQTDQRVLTSDAYGNGRWQPFGASYVQVISVDPQTSFTIADITGKYLYSNISFSLPPGLWMIEPNILIFRNTGVAGTNATSFAKRAWIKSIISDSNTVGTITGDVLPGGPQLVCSFLYAVGAGYNMMNGFFFINNASGAPKTYYYWYGNVSNLGLATNATFNFAGKNESFMSATYMGEAR